MKHETTKGLAMLLIGILIQLLFSLLISVFYSPVVGTQIFIGGLLMYVSLIIAGHLEDLIY